ncbi:uncharacterized protein LOC62_05G007281 [Vanrija pseudolonga]|uniref:PUB domain-containing protein n=1 Tax=Vanrija pseudolonga TaxID=143232 RepID=A0AAF1BSP6_9TREE|nr:hypothetical protein LOC62_05G007281 [Vanrija pseudolonga]
MSAADDARARRLAAIEARLAPAAPEPAPASTSASGPSSGATTPLFGARPAHLPKPWTRPSARDENERRRELARILNRTIIRDSSYSVAVACVETLIKIAENIQAHPDDKYRRLKTDNPALKNKVFAAPGGRDFLALHMGFHSETHDFVQTFALDRSERRLYELSLATDTLRAALPELQSRLSTQNIGKSNAKADEAARVAAAKRQIEADREEVKERADRERVARAAREKAATDLAARKAALDSTGAEVGAYPTTETADMLLNSTAEEHNANEDDEEDEDDVDRRGDFRPTFSHPDGDGNDGPGIEYGTRHRGHRWGDGNKLGKQ